MPAAYRRTRNSLILGFVLGLAALAFVAVVARASTSAFIRTAAEVAQRQRVLDACSDARRALTRAESEQRGYLLTGSRQYFESFDQAPTDLKAAFARAREGLGNGDPDLDAAEQIADQKFQEMSATMAAYSHGGASEAREIIRTDRGLQLMRHFRSLMGGIEGRQRQAMRLAAVRSEQNRIRSEWSTMSGLAFAAFVVLVSMRIVLRDLRRRVDVERKLDRYVHELESTAAELAKSRDEAVAATRAKSEFLANMSHEIRTPMNGVLGMANLLQSTALNERQRGFVRTILASAESLLTILNDILDLSKMEAGKMSLERYPFDLRSLIEDLCEALAPSAHTKGLELNCIFLPDVPEFVLGDPGRLRQIITNLVSNAVKFTNQGEVDLQVEAEPGADGTALFRFIVRDTGIGISSDRIDRIFESFTQADGSTTREFGGTGLGLTISRQLIELMGGVLRVRSQPGRGSEFWIEVPLSLQEASIDTASRQDLGGKRVLIVDDNNTNRTVLREMLRHWNCYVMEAENGKQALGAAREGVFDCVILDLHMPAMDGIETAKALRSNPETSGIALVLLSSSGVAGDDPNSPLFDGVLFKPIRSAPLYNTVAHVTGQGQTVEPPFSSDGPAEEEPALRGLRVLVAEDNEVNQMVATEYLQNWGCRTVTAENGAVAVALYRQETFDVILMDVQMPVMDGFEATAEIRRLEEVDGGHIPILAMTANAMSGDRERCLSAGMDGYLSKPLQPRILKERLLAFRTEATTMSDDTGGETPLFDPKRLDETCAGKAVLKLKVIERYIATAGASVDAIESANALSDTAALASAAHALKGSSLTLGSPLLSSLCERVEHGAREGRIESETVNEIRPGLERLKVKLEEVANEIRANV